MNQNIYPKICTHRDNAHSQVVVANAEQEAELPDEYRPAVRLASGDTISAADHAADVLLSPEYADLMAAREKLEQDRTEFADHVANVSRELAADRNTLDADRARLVEGYTADKAKQDADRARLDEEIAKWKATKAGQQPDQGGADQTEGTTDQPASTTPALPVGPTKRVRQARG